MMVKVFSEGSLELEFSVQLSNMKGRRGWECVNNEMATLTLACLLWLSSLLTTEGFRYFRHSCVLCKRDQYSFRLLEVK